MTIPRNLSFLAQGASATGVLSVPYGGTGLTSLTQGYIPFGQGTSALGNTSKLFWDNTNFRFGVNTSAPGQALEVNGGIVAGGAISASTNGLGIFLGNASSALGATTYATLIQDAGGYGTYSDLIIIPRSDSTPGNIRFYTGSSGGSERMRINSDGTLLVGTTTSIGAGGLTVAPNSDAGSAQIFFNRNTTTATSYAVIFRNAGGTVGSIAYSNTLTLFNTTSDYRLKTVIGVVIDAGQRIDALEPIEYNWNNNGTRTRGFLAHQFAEIYPSSVSGEKDAVDENGSPVYQAMQASTSEVMADLISEIQSLRKRVATLENK
jgi:hypothetical protein